MYIGIGAGVYFESRNTYRSLRLENDCSVIKGEVGAIKQVADMISESNISGKAISIYIC